MFTPPPRDLKLDGLDSLNPDQRAELLDYWRSRADAEWTTMEALDHVREDLLALGAPSILTELAARSIADERSHSTWCHAMAERVATTNLPRPKLRGSRRLTLPGASSSENRLLRPIFAGCLSETIAVCVLRSNRDEIRPGFIREAQLVHLSDEVHHSRLGWAFLAYAHESGWLKQSSQEAIQSALPMMCALVKDLWCAGDISDEPELAALGYLTRAQIDVGIETAFREVITPGLEKFGLRARLEP
jgi:hypothetical protein